MHNFAVLLDRLYFTYSHLGKLVLLKEYFAKTSDPERGFALAIMSGNLSFTAFKSTLIRDIVSERVDPNLFAMSYDYVGDLSETVALLWPETNAQKNLPSLVEVIETLSTLPKSELKIYLSNLLDNCNQVERWALLKLGTGSLRIGVSTRFLKQALAQYGNQDVQEIETLWHALQPPYLELFAWLENKSEKPNVQNNIYFHPVMLAHPLDDDEISKMDMNLFAVERKYDGIRVQLVSTSKGQALYSRSGDEISEAFSDLLKGFSAHVVLDGELVIKTEQGIGSFNDLQQRLNRKVPSKKLMQESPAFVIVYDILFSDDEDVRALSFLERRQILEKWFAKYNPSNMMLSEILSFNENTSLADLRNDVLQEKHIAVEGLMLKRKDSAYLPGRPTGYWYKWKRDPLLVDAVLMYAQRGSGKRSSYYSDYTFGLWKEDTLLPIGKAYSGFTDEELKALDKWIRTHTIAKFGPVREVEKGLVFEVAFDAVNLSSRHKSGVALRFPRINRIRWDKPAKEADELATLQKLIRE